MSKLEDIPKKPFFRVPEGYFDKLPAHVQARIETATPSVRRQSSIRYALAYALPLLIVALFIVYNFRSPETAENMLAAVETAELIQYIAESEITTEEMLQQFEFSTDELETLESDIYGWFLEEDDNMIESEFDAL